MKVSLLALPALLSISTAAFAEEKQPFEGVYEVTTEYNYMSTSCGDKPLDRMSVFKTPAGGYEISFSYSGTAQILVYGPGAQLDEKTSTIATVEQNGLAITTSIKATFDSEKGTVSGEVNDTSFPGTNHFSGKVVASTDQLISSSKKIEKLPETFRPEGLYHGKLFGLDGVLIIKKFKIDNKGTTTLAATFAADHMKSFSVNFQRGTWEESTGAIRLYDVSPVGGVLIDTMVKAKLVLVPESSGKGLHFTALDMTRSGRSNEGEFTRETDVDSP